MNARQVAQYYLARSSADGDLITNLKMQKLVYYAYVWVLVNQGKKLFSESIEAWPNGPVVAELYHDLKKFGSMPIDDSFIGDINELMSVVDKSGHKEVLDDVYERYISMSAFDLVTLTHNEQPWLEARDGKKPTEAGSAPIKDDTILAFHHKK